MRPPRVSIGFIGVLMAKSIDKARVEEILEAFSFFVSEAVLTNILLGIGQINLLMSDVEVATKQDWFLGF